MASEFGLGITPWSPLKGGVLSGRYTRANSGRHSADRGAMVDAFLNEKTYAVIDELEAIARAHATNVASVALAWVRAQRAVSSVIINQTILPSFRKGDMASGIVVGTEQMLLALGDNLAVPPPRPPGQEPDSGHGSIGSILFTFLIFALFIWFARRRGGGFGASILPFMIASSWSSRGGGSSFGSGGGGFSGGGGSFGGGGASGSW